MFLRFRASRLRPEVRERLKLARARVMHRWIKGTDYRDGAYCLRGAIRVDGDIPPSVKNEAYEVVARAIGTYPSRFRQPQEALLAFNDKSARTQEEVVAVLDKALNQ